MVCSSVVANKTRLRTCKLTREAILWVASFFARIYTGDYYWLSGREDDAVFGGNDRKGGMTDADLDGSIPALALRAAGDGCGDDNGKRKRWIPAFAGMTEGGENDKKSWNDKLGAGVIKSGHVAQTLNAKQATNSKKQMFKTLLTASELGFIPAIALRAVGVVIRQKWG